MIQSPFFPEARLTELNFRTPFPEGKVDRVVVQNPFCPQARLTELRFRALFDLRQEPFCVKARLIGLWFKAPFPKCEVNQVAVQSPFAQSISDVVALKALSRSLDDLWRMKNNDGDDVVVTLIVIAVDVNEEMALK
ncbi:unnamed protein product [Vicia faba]|uniref:Uncharacterized protein n=1 Tax=Vicia faba TaxID=3906 RepID=A0AAV0ZZ19_VICFA|nr:unnamed protein product [Vicia faba]